MAVTRETDRNKKTWMVTIRVTDPITQQRHMRRKRGFATKAEAREWEADALKERRQSTSASFREIAELWELSQQTSEDTKTKHKEHFEKRFSEFYDLPIKSITKGMLINWRTDLIQSDYATSTKNQTISFVRSVFRFAHEMYDLPDVSRPLRSLRDSDAEILDSQEFDVWTAEEFRQFYDALSDFPLYQLFFEFMFWTGCRRGEAIALQKSDIRDGWAFIHSSQRTASQGLKPTKTKASRRIKLDSMLMEHIAPLLDGDGYLFGGDVPMGATSIRRYFLLGIERSQVKPIRIHDLRHSHATILINAGVNIVAVSRRLGHASIDQTLKTYTHLLESTDTQMMSKISDLRAE